jgi:hypothetical protein
VIRNTGEEQMGDEEKGDRQPTQLVERSIDPQTIIDGAEAYGAVAGGTGALLVGIAKIKETFGAGEAPEPAAPTEPTEG